MKFNPEYLEFDEESHTYWYQGEVIPSVTTIIKAADAGADYSGIPDYILKRAAEIGTDVHKRIELHYLEGSDPVSDDEKANEYLVGFEQFLADDVFECWETERKLACPKYWFSGTVDLVGWVNGELAVIDVKTTSKLHHETVEYQLSAYQYLAELFYEEPIPKRYALHLKKKGSRRYALEPMMSNPGARHQFLKWAVDYNAN